MSIVPVLRNLIWMDMQLTRWIPGPPSTASMPIIQCPGISEKMVRWLEKGAVRPDYRAQYLRLEIGRG